MTTINRNDIQFVQESRGNHGGIAEVLRQIRTPEQCFRTLARYAYFNAIFGSGVACLAGRIGGTPYLFEDRSEPNRMLCDRQREVAGRIFYAAVDEFDDRATTHFDTHRTLAQATVKGAARFFGFSERQVEMLTGIPKELYEAVHMVAMSYGIRGALNEEQMFNGIGFHLGSELLADQEFRDLVAFLTTQVSGFMPALDEMRVQINGVTHCPATWLRIHTSVEMDHFDSAVRGANTALQYYVGKHTPGTVKMMILDGFGGFCDVQRYFLHHLMDE